MKILNFSVAMQYRSVYNLLTPNNKRSNDMKNSLAENDLKCGMVAYEVTELNIRTIIFVSDVYTNKDINSKCIDYKSFYKKGEDVVLCTYVGQGFLNDHNIGASYNKNYWFSDYDSAKEYFDSVYDKDFKKFNHTLFI